LPFNGIEKTRTIKNEISVPTIKHETPKAHGSSGITSLIILASMADTAAAIIAEVNARA
jgi:hypothetical protein